MLVLERARVYSFDPATRRFVRRSAVVIGDEGRILSLEGEDAGAGVPRVNCDGATILPAFADCHVHLTDTGYLIGSRDLSATATYGEFVEAVARVPSEGGVVFAGQYDDARWRDGRSADAAPLERFFPSDRAMLARVDGHSCLVNARTLEWLSLDPQTAGIERDPQGRPTGRLLLEANWAAQERFLAAMPLRQRREAERRAVDFALSRGALHLHAQLYGFPREAYAVEIDALRALGAKIYPKICEPDASLARELALPYVGGDVFLDGSIGSRTAAMREPYADAATSGALRFDDARLTEFFAQADAMGIGAGVHAIGDAAIDQAVRVWERVLGGCPSRTGARHFIEHFECATQEHIDACARLGIALSMQPLFDAAWGGAGRMYERRLGENRMRGMNALARVVRSGALLCGGDDAPVCGLDPLGGMQACVEHRQPEERISVHDALAAYTVNAAYLARVEERTGNIAPGCDADLVMLAGDPFEDGFAACSVLETWSEGVAVYRATEARSSAVPSGAPPASA
jgi:predicted amidohydrolase YtcJ